MRDRMVRAKFWPDKKICVMSNDAQLVYIGIWGAANDFGVAPADPFLLKSDIDPRNTRWSMDKFKKCVQEIVDQHIVIPFMDGIEQWYFISAFPEHQRGIRRPNAFGYPSPPSDYLTTSAGQCPDNVQTMSVKCPPEVEGKGREGKGSRREVEEKSIYGAGVRLTDTQFETLTIVFGKHGTMEYIERLDNYMLSQGKQSKYKDHYRTILNWHQMKNPGWLLSDALAKKQAERQTAQPPKDLSPEERQRAKQTWDQIYAQWKQNNKRPVKLPKDSHAIHG